MPPVCEEWKADSTSYSSTKAIPNSMTGHYGFPSHRTRQQTCCYLFYQMAYPVSDQKTSRKEVIPLSGVPEAVFTVIGTNLLSHLMLDICSKLEKLT